MDDFFYLGRVRFKFTVNHCAGQDGRQVKQRDFEFIFMALDRVNQLSHDRFKLGEALLHFITGLIQGGTVALFASLNSAFFAPCGEAVIAPRFQAFSIAGFTPFFVAILPCSSSKGNSQRS